MNEPPPTPMNTLLLGSHPAIDFLNTSFAPDGKPVETIGDGQAFLDWITQVGLLEEPVVARLRRRVGLKACDATAAEARKIRQWAREWIGRWRTKPDADYGREIETLNKLLAHATFHRELVSGTGGLRIVDRNQIESPDALLAVIAESIAALISEESPSLVRACAGSGCTLWFLDRTRGHRRLFCSAAVCGNRAKVAAFRERQRN